MDDSIDTWAETIKNYSPLDKARDLFEQLEINHDEISTISINIKRAETDNLSPDILQQLYMNEFHLLMNNVGLFEDIMLNLDRINKNQENELEVRRIRKNAPKLCLVNVMELNNDND